MQTEQHTVSIKSVEKYKQILQKKKDDDDDARVVRTDNCGCAEMDEKKNRAVCVLHTQSSQQKIKV